MTPTHGAYHCGTLCCYGNELEMRNKVENETRGPCPIGWEVRPLDNRCHYLKETKCTPSKP